ncbi:imm11 family protein [Homoserinibacter sp. GY 40078]|uniref:imm11 family protein n=1 Tax=Homoserinibacter sp. GY 40078 TaxID=2603275 RepID=UPI0011C86270|nr:DUF1629 domain-containing protein [Homoserinibacter sp. GY 40078]TXK18760.1 hypothetical protein FVQ89_02120 [Homoserinibacter sp. GY 40078]
MVDSVDESFVYLTDDDLWPAVRWRILGPDAVLECELVDRERGVPLEYVNLPWLNEAMPIADARAYEVLEPLLRDCGHWVRIDVRGRTDQFHGFVSTRRLDAVDDRSEISRLKATGKLMNIRRLVLKDEMVAGVNAFTLSIWPWGPIYFSQDVVDAVKGAGLTGWTWSIVWSNESGYEAVEQRLFGW